MDKFPKLLTVEEVAQILRLEPETVRAWARAKKIPAYKIGGDRGEWRFDESQIRTWLETCHQPANTQ